jgi:deoxyadenosine/deoxycytidine kinase
MTSCRKGCGIILSRLRKEKHNMGKIIAVLGNCGSGKTTLAKMLCEREGYTGLLEQHAERPYHDLFFTDLPRYALANQVDYLLYRAEQEEMMRLAPGVGVVDGGLEQDFHLFTRLFYQRAYLTEAEYGLCCRLYARLRASLPPPDVIVCLRAPLEVLIRRRMERARAVDITGEADLPFLETCLDEWLAATRPAILLTMDTSGEGAPFMEQFADIAGEIRRLLS